MIKDILELEKATDIVTEKRVKVIKRRLLYLYEIVVDITFVLKEVKNGIYYYNYSYTVDCGLDNDDIRKWVDSLILQKPWTITGNRSAIVL